MTGTESLSTLYFLCLSRYVGKKYYFYSLCNKILFFNRILTKKLKLILVEFYITKSYGTTLPMSKCHAFYLNLLDLHTFLFVYANKMSRYFNKINKNILFLIFLLKYFILILPVKYIFIYCYISLPDARDHCDSG